MGATADILTQHFATLKNLRESIDLFRQASEM